MNERAQAPTNDEDSTPVASDDQPDPPAAEASAVAPEPGEAENPVAQRRARLRKEIRAGMQRALKH